MKSGQLTAADLESLRRLGIPPELVEEAGIVRVTDAQARERWGMRTTGDLAGVVFPYWNPEKLMAGERRHWYCRLRRDRPPTKEGKPENKYVCPYGDRKHLYLPPAPELYLDAAVPVVLVEAEKSALALLAWSRRLGRKLLPVGLGGCWGWRGKIGKRDLPYGGQEDEKGPLPDLKICCPGRETIVLLDANAATSADVEQARRALVEQLEKQEARVRVAHLPQREGVNGPDDYIAVCGDVALAHVLDGAGREALEFMTPQGYESLKKPEWIIAGVCQQYEITGIGAAWKQGKTWLALSLAKALLSGKPWLGHFPVSPEARDRQVYYLIPEVSAAALKPRLELMGLGEYVRNGRLRLNTLSEHSFPLDHPQFLKLVDANYVVIDTIVRYWRAGEATSSAAMKQNISDKLLHLVHAGALGVFALAHSTKASAKDTSGMVAEDLFRDSGDLLAALSNALGVRQLDAEHNVSFVELLFGRDNPREEPVRFVFQGRPDLQESGDLRIIRKPEECGTLRQELELRGLLRPAGRPARQDKAAKLEDARQYLALGLSERETAEKLGISRTTLQHWLKEDGQGKQYKCFS